jgi:hypothetical protein
MMNDVWQCSNTYSLFYTLIGFDKIWRNVYVLKLDSAYCFHFSLLTPFIFQDYQLREKQARKVLFDSISYNFIHIFQMLFRFFFLPRRRNFYLWLKYLFLQYHSHCRCHMRHTLKLFRSVIPYISAIAKIFIFQNSCAIMEATFCVLVLHTELLWNEIWVRLKDDTIMYGSNCEFFVLFLFRVESEFVDISGAGFYDNL